MKTGLKQSPRDLTGEGAKLVLDEVRRRYGIDAPRQEKHAGISLMPSVPQPQPQQPPGSGSGTASRSSDPVSKSSSSLGVPMNFASEPYAARVETATGSLPNGAVSKSTREGSPAGKWAPPVPQEVHAFHYLIRIMECTSLLHCEVFAENVTAARRQVDQIPNLVECRAASAMALAEIKAGKPFSPEALIRDDLR